MPNHWANIRDLAYVNCLFKLDVQLRERCGRSFQDDFADSSFHFSKLSKQFFLKKKQIRAHDNENLGRKPPHGGCKQIDAKVTEDLSTTTGSLLFCGRRHRKGDTEKETQRGRKKRRKKKNRRKTKDNNIQSSSSEKKTITVKD